MLANFLPGIRDLRAPLSAGYVWLFALYLAFEPQFPSEVAATGVWDSLLTLKKELSIAGVAIAASFLAYIIGSVSEAVVRGLVAVVVLPIKLTLRFDAPPTLPLFVKDVGESWDAGKRVISRYGLLLPEALASAKAEAAVGELTDARVQSLTKALQAQHMRWASVLERVRVIGPEPPGLPGAMGVLDPLRDVLLFAAEMVRLTPAALQERHADDIARDCFRDTIRNDLLGELALVRTRLLGTENELFSAIDRLRAEAEFRLAVAPALLGLAGALAWRATWSSAALVGAVSFALVVQGFGRMAGSRDALLEALRIKRAAAPSLERIDDVIKQLSASKFSRDEIAACGLPSSYDDLPPIASAAPATATLSDPSSLKEPIGHGPIRLRR